MNSIDEYITLNFSDIVFNYYFSKEVKCTNMIHDHYLVYLFSGEYHIEEGKKKIIVKPGECVFLRRDVGLSTYKMGKRNEPFRSIAMKFTRPFLIDFYRKIADSNIPTNVKKFKESAVKMPASADVISLFRSMTTYVDANIKPSEEIMSLKLLEGIYSLLNMDERFFPTLFDFTDPWKIDLQEFMNKNYMYELSMEEIASFTGRSLSTFKRDFKKISDLTPQKWIIQQRLVAARRAIQEEGKRVREVYTEVGFKNESHFYNAYKKYFGVAPGS